MALPDDKPKEMGTLSGPSLEAWSKSLAREMCRAVHLALCPQQQKFYLMLLRVVSCLPRT
jgi:hypothetical protein